jgi:flavin-dependent dehydrogenase
VITCDVLIVGGGPAGSTCAWKLRAAGLDVIVVDRATFPRDKVCGGWITPQVVDDLRLDTEDYRRGRTLQPITGFRTGTIGGRREIETSYDSPVSYGIRRREFDDYLLRRSGATVRSGVPIASIRREGNRWIVNDAMQAPMLVGAGGHF